MAIWYKFTPSIWVLGIIQKKSTYENSNIQILIFTILVKCLPAYEIS